jgi:hypothetical protein
VTDTSAAPASGADAAKRPQRTPEEIEAEIVRTRDSLSDSLDVIEAKVRPSNLIAVARAKAMSVVTTKDGSLDPKKAGAVAAVVLVLVVYVIRRRRL